MRKQIRLLIFILIPTFLLSCSPSKKLLRYYSKIDKVYKEYPKLKEQIGIDSLIRKDSIRGEIIFSDSLYLEKDSLYLDHLDQLFSYKLIHDSLLNIKRDSSNNNKIEKESKEIKEKIDKKIEELPEVTFKEKRFNIQIPFKYNYRDSTIVKNIEIKLFYYRGKIHVIGHDNLDIKYDRTDYNLNISREFTLFQWVKDSKTIILILLCLFLILLIFINRR